MKNWLSNLWIKIWRMWRIQFFFRHFCIVVVAPIVFSSWIFLICWDGNDSIWCKIITWLVENIHIVLMLLYLLSNFYLAKRFQDCWICGIRAFALWIMFPIILSFIFIILFKYIWTKILELAWRLFYPYLIAVIVMCFVKWDSGPNKYGDEK